MTRAKTIVYFECRGGCCGQTWEEKITLHGTYSKTDAVRQATMILFSAGGRLDIRPIKVLHST